MFKFLSINQVSFNYDKTPILKDVSMTIYPGEFIHVIGPNGGGKTTLLKLLMGFIEPSSGSIKIFGNSPEKKRQNIAYVPQVFPFDKLFPISVYEVVLSGRLSNLKWHGRYTLEDKRAANQALKDVDLLHIKDYSIGSLSGGQIQRILIARALASSPQILLLDEPTSCIDCTAQHEVEQVLSRLKGKLTIIMVTHDLENIGKHSDRVFCIHGKVIELKPQDVCSHLSMGLYNKPNKENLFEVITK